MKTVFIVSLYFLAICAASYWGFVALMAARYGESWEAMSKVVNEVLLDTPLKTGILIIMIGLLSYWAAWFSFRKKRRM
jgi:hypothetical protein